MTRIAFQDRMLDNHCFGCGPNNEKGLRIKSFWDGDDSVCTFRPSPEHAAGPKRYLNGGIIATIIDCHGICTAVADLYRAEGREIGTEPSLWCVTGTLSVRYMAPVPIDRPVELRATIVERAGKRMNLECLLLSDGDECARGEVVAIRVPPEWRGDHAPRAGAGS